MSLEVKNHLKHIAATFGNLLEKLEVDPLLAAELSSADFSEAIKKTRSLDKDLRFGYSGRNNRKDGSAPSPVASAYRQNCH